MDHCGPRISCMCTSTSWGASSPHSLRESSLPLPVGVGYVMGLATWKAVLQDCQRCPFTKRPVTVEQLTVLTMNNIARFRDRIQH